MFMQVLGTGLILSSAMNIAAVRISKIPTDKHRMFLIGPYTVEARSESQPLENGHIVAEITPDQKNKLVRRVKVDNLFWHLPEEIQKSILAHEVGHMVREGGFDLYSLALGIRNTPCEMVADQLSVELYGKVTTLKMLLALMTVSGPTAEMLKRISAVISS